MIKKIILAIFLCQFTYSQQVLELKDRAILIEKIQKDRLDNLLPKLMSKNEIDMWIIITREYNEDPIIKTLLPPTWLNARRRTILVFSYNELTNKTESVAISRYNFGKNIKSIAYVGNLVDSVIFCLNKVKDTGNILPGHGGLLDRVDGIIFAIPVSFFLNYFKVI